MGGNLGTYEGRKPYLDSVGREDDVLTIFEKISEDSPMLMVMAGSARRGLLDCGDLDVVVLLAGVLSRERQMRAMAEHLAQFGEVHYLTKSGGLSKGQTLIWPDGFQIDINFTDLDGYGACMMHSTGSADTNKRQRYIASRKGYLLNDKGLFRKAGSDDPIDYSNGSGDWTRVPDTETEEGIYAELGFHWLRPEDR